ncbi:MAG: hypothetical protein PHE26_12865, partial [Syntrophomonadaceae bacterium]|nr:hypothetical protein [Syntrophomonadaceae bacterium]
PHYYLSPITKYLSIVCESSWEVHEGAATIYPYLLKKPFSLALLHRDTYKDMPSRYINAATDFAKCVGALVPAQLANFGHVFANAVAQFCLNTKLLNHATDYWDKYPNISLNETYDIYNHLSNSQNNPKNRLYKLIAELYKDEDNLIPERINLNFIQKLLQIGMVTKVNDSHFELINNDTESIIRVNDLLNYTILSEIENLIPGWTNYKRVIEYEQDFKLLMNAVNNAQINVSCISDFMSDDMKRRAAFKPVIKKI